MNRFPLKRILLSIALAACSLVFCCCASFGGFVRPTLPPQITAAPTQAPLSADNSAPTDPDCLETSAPLQSVPLSTCEPTVDDLIWEYINGMSAEQRIGQLAMFGFSGKTTIPQEFISIINTYQIGNIILYGANINRDSADGGFANAQALINQLDATNSCGVPRLYSIDVEGGRVHRFTWDEPLLSPMELGGMDAQAAFDQFAYIAETLRSIGITMDLAPVLDIAENPLDTFLGTRIISSNAEIASTVGGAIIDGLHSGGCLAVCKHFPGHGGTTDDSHEATPVITKTIAELYSYDLVPFTAAISHDVDGVLVSHILYPALDSVDIASMSNTIISGVLRGEMGFDGLVISDDFRMQGLLSQYSPDVAAVQFILAGGDIILCGANYSIQTSVMSALTQAYAQGTISDARLNKSVFRILNAKYNAGIWSPTDLPTHPQQP